MTSISFPSHPQSITTSIHCSAQFRLSEIRTLTLLKGFITLTAFNLLLKIHLVWSRPQWVTLHEEDCFRIYHVKVATATDNVVNFQPKQIVLSLLSELEKLIKTNISHKYDINFLFTLMKAPIAAKHGIFVVVSKSLTMMYLQLSLSAPKL